MCLEDVNKEGSITEWDIIVPEAKPMQYMNQDCEPICEPENITKRHNFPLTKWTFGEMSVLHDIGTNLVPMTWGKTQRQET